MNIPLFFQDLIKRGAKLWIEEEQLRCQGPGEVLTPEVLEILKLHKSEFLDLLRENTIGSEEYPLSHGQKALWFLNQDAKESAAYNIAASLRICSPLDVAAMERAFQYLVDRHPLLRAYFPVQDGKPLQRIRGNQNVWFEIVDAADRSEENLKQQVIQAYQQPFDLAAGPLLRIHLFRRSEEDHVLLITVHHIVIDGWSVWLLMDEFSKVYSSITASQTPNLPPLQYNYRNYIQWQTEMLDGAEGEKLWQYWQKKLAGEIPVLQLPTDRPRPPVQTFHGATIDFSIDETLTGQLRELARAEGTTLFTVLMAAFHVLLHRYTGQDDILVGTPTVGRDNRDFTGIAGYFVNPVVIRTDCEDNPTFRSFLLQICDTVLGAIEHQDYPFPLLVERLQPKRSPGFSPLFQVDFVLQKAQVGDFTNLFDVMGKTEVTMNWGGLEIKPFVIPQEEGQFDVTLEIIELENSLSGHLRYNTDLFNADTIKRMAGHFEVLLRGIVQNPAQQITALPLLTHAEQQKLLEWNQTETDYPKDKTIVDLFEEQVEKTPDNIAVVFEEKQLTYRELNRKANQLAHYLLSLKSVTDNSPLITENCLVGICMERSLDMVIGLLGILKAGGAYVPLDPEYPEHRLQFMLEDSQVSVLLSQSHLLESLPSSNAKAFCLDSEWKQIEGCSGENPVRQSGPEQLAYVIYTSGSTGKPKGCQVTHYNVTRLFTATEEWYHFKQQDVWTLFHSYAFDFSVWELWGALFHGGKLVIVPYFTSRTPEDFYQLLIEQGVTVLNQTPSAFQQLISVDNQPDELSLRLVIFGGETLDYKILQPWFDRRADRQPLLVNMYGITETTVHVTYHPITADQIPYSNLIGCPIADLQVWVLDEHLQPVPIGVSGEMYVGGAGVTNGYLNRHELTKEKFIEVEVFGKSKQLYKTGDRARWLPNGNLEYQGRIDYQVKLRGFRIELGEIESTLSQHESVKEAVVVLYEKEDNPNLAAYVILTTPVTGAVSVLRTWLKNYLPEYMIPSSFTVLEELSLTSNGKIDRKALPVPDLVIPTELVVPRTETDSLLCNLWSQVLGVEVTSINTNFFESGGHSLLATQLVSRIRDAFQIELPVRTVFELPTVVELSRAIEKARLEKGTKVRPSITPVSRDEALPLSFAQERLFFLDQLVPGNPFYNIPMALQITGILNVNALGKSFLEIINRHEALRTSFQNKDGIFQQIIESNLTRQLPIINLESCSEEERDAEIKRIVREEELKPFDLTTPHLLRTVLLRLAEDNHILIVNMHHIVSDGWSMGILIRELTLLYESFLNEESSPLHELEIQYADFASWQRKWLSGKVLESQLNYWKEQLADLPRLELPTDKPRPAIASYKGNKVDVVIEDKLTLGLKRLSNEAGASLFMTLLAAFAGLMSRYSGQDDIVLGAPIANRNHQEIESLIGFFVNTQVLRIDISGDPEFKELLSRVRKTALDAYANQDIPFEQLVEELQPERDMSRNPLVQVMFVLQNAPMADIELKDLKIKELELESIMVRFDLEFHLWEVSGELKGALLYSTELFEHHTVVRMVEYFKTMLEEYVKDPCQRVLEVPILTEQERYRLITEWNNTQSRYPQDRCIHQLFEEQVEKTPEAIALVSGQERLTYGELNIRANQLAHYLRDLGVGPEIPVGVFLERSVEMIIAILGILKAGGAYVPLDPGYPEERLSFMIADSGIRILATDEKLSTRIEGLKPLNADIISIRLDSEWGTIIEKGSDENPVCVATPQNLVYVMYTSGSTGRPKGTRIIHYNVTRLVMDTNYINVTPEDTFLQHSPISFDASTFEIWGSLLNGSQLIVLLPGIPSLDELGDIIKQYEVTTLWLTAGLFHLMIDERIDDLRELRYLLAGGDVLSPLHVNKALRELKETTLINGYGPTENTTFTCCYTTSGPIQGSVPIGNPVSNTEVYILDKYLQPVPVGVPGELYIGGAGLARDYVNCPDLTAEKFIPNPFHEEIMNNSGLIADNRMYKTSDRARYLPDGNIEFLGRTDHQVKIRGFRIEPGEIETVISDHHAVREVVVIDHNDEGEEKRLVAYIVPEKELLNQLEEQKAKQLEQDHVFHWKSLYEDIYDLNPDNGDITFNITGWNSSYTGLPIPEVEMREWVDYSVKQILDLNPTAVLEIGCGTGLLLSRIAPHCKKYFGTDFSEKSIKYIRKIQELKEELDHVKLSQRLADDFDGVEPGIYDTVILNSIVQYFPHIDYLAKVVEGILKIIRQGGAVFIGDIRSLPLQRAYHTSVQMYQAPAGRSLNELKNRINYQISREEELLIDPAFFIALKEIFPEISNVKIQHQWGSYHNELTRFRYDVILHVSAKSNFPEKIDWLDWEKEGLTKEDLPERLRVEEPELLGICNVPDARIEEMIKAVEILKLSSGIDTVEQLREAVSVDTCNGVDPIDLWTLGNDSEYSVNVLQSCSKESFDVLFRKNGSSINLIMPYEEGFKKKPLSYYANHPQQHKINHFFIQELHGLLWEKLPDYMIPTNMVILDAIPLTSHGKIDRKALPTLEMTEDEEDYIAPGTPTEEIVCAIWSEVLGRERLGIYDNFFDMGGHSLMATQVISRIREAFHIELQVRGLFEYPTVSKLSKTIENLRYKKEINVRPSITQVSREDALSLSYAQERLWFLGQMESTSASYNMAGGLCLKGELNVIALKKAVNEILRRHEALRTSFKIIDGTPVQEIAPELKLMLSVKELSAEEAEQYANREALQPFDMSTGPLFRAVLLKTAPKEFLLFIIMHHIVSDGWSLGIFSNELKELYTDYSQGEESHLPELAVQYADYACWQRQWLKGEALEEQLNYWREQLKGMRDVLELPTYKPRSPIQTYNGSVESFTIDQDLTYRVMALGRQQGVSLFMTLYGAFVLLLFRYTGQDDIAIGSPIANRNQKDTESLIGFFVNTLVLRTKLSGCSDFSELLNRVRTLTLDAYAYQDIPFERLVEVLSPERNMSHSPLFQVMFALQNAPEEEFELPGLEISSLELENTIARFDLTLQMRETDHGLTGSFEYNTDLFHSSFVRHMIGHFKTMLEAVVENPGMRITELPIMPKAEREKIVFEWNQTEREFPQDTCIHQLFEEQVEKTPDAIAVVFEKQHLTYRELNRKANQFAHYLLNLKTDTDNCPLITDNGLVGICIERSPEMIIGILGILKAGGAYVPLDPTYPEERLAYMIEDSNIQLLLTQRSIPASISSLQSKINSLKSKILSLDLDEICGECGENPICHVCPESLAYMIYTSGSTGKPNGVELSHRGLCNLAKEQIRMFGVQPESRILQFASLGFDASIFEIVMVLCSGAQLYLSKQKTLIPGAELVQFINQSAITHTVLPPSVLATMSSDDLPRLTTVIAAGEQCPLDVGKMWSKNRRFFNAYGPTEATVCTTIYECDGEDILPIGRPLSNFHVYILDQNLQPVPVGISGELYIGGSGLARGYHKRPGTTAEKFIPNPFTKEPGQRMYRTGDLVKYLPDGKIEFLGRIDHQVKIRGFRIEPGEIEAQLTGYQGVKDCVVIARQDGSDHKQLVAYVVADRELETTELRDYVKGKLPDYMVPAYFITLEKLPMTPNGKIDRNALSFHEQIQQQKPYSVSPATDAEREIEEVWREVLKQENFGLDDNFFDMGGHSLLLVRVQSKLKQIFDKDIPVFNLFQYPTIRSLANYLTRGETHSALLESRMKRTRQVNVDIAIIGLNGRFPGAQNIDQFWRNLQAGEESITFFTDEELMSSGIDNELLHNPDYVKANGVLEGIDRFDASFFGISPREAEMMDPQHRLFLEICWEVIEGAGYNPEVYRGLIGVYAGVGMNSYLLSNLISNPELLKSTGGLQFFIGNDKDFVPTRVSYKLNLKGPSINVNTACSTSLVAVQLACQGLMSYQCDMALAGGVTIHVPQKSGYLYQEEGVVSPDGHCRAFDRGAKGTVGGSGAGVVMLKRLDDAIKDGDMIHAVIKGAAMNNDGSMKVGYTAPGVQGQIEVINRAIEMAEINPETITYLETHGTGTALGDPIEVKAMTSAFRMKTQKKGFCAIGSVKTNVGHLDTAAGVTSLIKAVLSLKHRQIPASLHFETPNPEIDFVNSPFYVNRTLSEWKTNGIPRRAGVSSFGIGGTNAHVILEEAPSVEPSNSEKPWQLLSLSAKTEAALEEMTGNLAWYIKETPDLNIEDVAYTLHVGRKAFCHRRIVVCRNVQDAVDVLESRDPKRVLTHNLQPGKQSVAFMFPGMGEHYVNMSRGIYEREPAFRQEIDRCVRILEPLLGVNLKEILYREEVEESYSSSQEPRFDLKKMLNPDSEDTDEASKRLNRAKFAHSAVFVVEYALAKLWMHWGIKPRAMIGYSLGEYVAACLSGVLSLEDALRILVKRAELIDRIPEGTMLAVPLPEGELRNMLGDELSLAVINTPSLCVAAGPEEAVMKLEESLNKRDILSRRIRTSHAFHSKMMEPIKEEFTKFLKTLSFSPPEIPFISNVTGTWIQDAEATDPSYWAEHTCRTVHFNKGVGLLLEDTDTALLEVGPGQSLTGFALQHPNNGKDAGGVVLASLRNRNENIPDELFLLNSLGRLWLGGVEVDFSSLYAGERRLRVPLPTYPFEKRRYWIESGHNIENKLNTTHEEKTLPRLEIQDWFSVPTWKRTVSSHIQWDGKWRWMVFTDETGLGNELIEWLKQKEQEVILVRNGEEFSIDQQDSYTLKPDKPEDYSRLISTLKESGKLPDNIIHLWSMHFDYRKSGVESKLKSIHESLGMGFYSLTFLAQAMGEEGVQEPMKLGIITNNMQSVTSDDIIFPEMATILGPCKVIPQEYKNFTCSSIDLAFTEQQEMDFKPVIEQVTSEFLLNLPDQVVAYRGYRRWVQTFEHMQLEDTEGGKNVLRKGGVYLITGGLGGIGLGVAKYLVEKVQATPVLVGRTGLPPREHWDEILRTHNEDDINCVRIRSIRSLESSGMEIPVFNADVSDREKMSEVIEEVLKRFPAIHGVFHTAGLPGAGLIQLKTRDMAEEVFAPKVQGTLVLEEVLKDIPLDFMALFSSNTSLMSEVGQVDYCAANAFLDSYAHYRSFHLKRKTITVNWDAWKWDNWQKTLMKDLPELYNQIQHYRETYGLSLEEGAEAMARSLSSMEPQVIVSTRDFIKLMEHHKTTHVDWDFTEEAAGKSLPASTHERPNLGTPYVPPENETEEQIIAMWQELLGIDKIGIYDNFFQLGGHSLLGIQLISRLRETFEVEVPLKALFNAPTVIDLTRLIEEMILLEIEGLSEDEISEQVSGIRQNQESVADTELEQHYKLPNKMVIRHLNKAETDHFYKDIFDDSVYYKNGIKIQKGDIVFDVGANIGLFALFIQEKFEDVTVYSFEPAPPLFEILKANTSQYVEKCRLFNCGLSRKPGEAEFTFYPRTAGMSSFYADKKEEMEVLTAIMKNQQRLGMDGMDRVLEHTDELLEERFRKRTFDCQLRRLSDIIEEYKIECISLLKIDVQKSELDVIEGIDGRDWNKISQVVIEAHNIDGRIDHIRALLGNKGYTVQVEQDELYIGSNIYNIYGIRQKNE
ncbi:MAG: amino acid adenylation domain-containing protein [Planctomycetes bacterium]|nr:amino acid adenylation domain-containing protein [Planctomycetota bacterium]